MWGRGVAVWGHVMDEAFIRYEYGLLDTRHALEYFHLGKEVVLEGLEVVTIDKFLWDLT